MLQASVLLRRRLLLGELVQATVLLMEGLEGAMGEDFDVSII